jgi:hypothetical protein
MRRRKKEPKRITVTVQLPPEDLAKLRYQSLRRRLGDDHPETLATVREVAALLARSPGDLDEAVETYMNLIRFLWERDGPEDRHYQEVVLEAAEVVRRSGDRRRADEMVRHVRESRR